MSHVTDLKAEVKDLDVLEASLPAELELRRGKTTFAWWGRFVGDSTPPAGYRPEEYGKCDHAIGYRGRTPQDGPGGEWEIGVVKSENGYRLLCDEYGSVGRRLTQHIPHIRREYAVNMTKKRARTLVQQGWQLKRIELPGGAVRMRLQRG